MLLMGLSSLQLDAFLAVAQQRSFSKAAKVLHVTQSALSQRLLNFEKDLGQSLLIRKSSGLELTEAGKKILHYAMARESLESELLQDLKGNHKEQGLSGYLRVGAYSSVMRSVVMPSLMPFLQKNPRLQCEFVTRSSSTLKDMLLRAELDFIVSDTAITTMGLIEKLLGHERYVVIEPRNKVVSDNVYLDNEPADTATELFFRAQSTMPKYRRSFMSDIYGIIDGVSSGIGRAVVCEHLINSKMPVKVVKRFRPLLIDVRLYYFSQPYYSQLFSSAIEAIQANARSLLSIKHLTAP